MSQREPSPRSVLVEVKPEIIPLCEGSNLASGGMPGKERMSPKTRALDHLSCYISQLEDGQQTLTRANQHLTRENTELHAKLALAQEQLSISTILRQSLEKTQHTSELLSSTLADERASKRQRENHFVIQ